jgi:hypothetical protein
MKKFNEFLAEKGYLVSEKAARSGIMHWAYPDGYMRSHYSAGYFMPVAADALQKMGPKVDDHEVDHGEMVYKHHERIKRQEKA